VGLLASLASCHKPVAAVHPPATAPAPLTVTKSAPPTAKPGPPAARNEAVRAAEPDAATKATIQSLLNHIQDVYFDYDKHTLRLDAEAVLAADAKALADILKLYPHYMLTIEGFCDERGSDEYNIALGDARAKKAREFLEVLGLPATQLRTVSFGKEKSVCAEHNESCWQKNRRAHVTQEQPS
jgi:peptidoglycan-associated lipoprotein